LLDKPSSRAFDELRRRAGQRSSERLSTHPFPWVELEQQFDLASVVVDELSGGIPADILERKVQYRLMSPSITRLAFSGISLKCVPYLFVTPSAEEFGTKIGTKIVCAFL
jgi:hypothetical protein